MTGQASRDPRCFFEDDPGLALSRRAGVEGIGTLLLVFAAVGGGLAAQRGGASPVLATVVVAACVAGALVGLVIAFGPISGGHFNPLISVLQWLAGKRSGRCAAAYVVSQLAGGLLGALLARSLTSTTRQVGDALDWRFGASEMVASFALLLVVFASARTGQRAAGAGAVGAWLFAAIVATPSGSLANPAVVLGALAAAGPLAVPPTVALLALCSEALGALAALGAFTLMGLANPTGSTRASPDATG